MTRYAILLRGINLGSKRRIAMPELRELLVQAGFEEVRTYLQSGNVVLAGEAPPEQVARTCEQEIAQRFGFPVELLVRTDEELEEVVRRNPLAEVADNPKRYQVTFLSADPDPRLVRELTAVALPQERLVAHGRELYAWHPDGVSRSPLWNKLAGRGLGATATSRNWTTVTALLEMARGR